jgi:hypothetical protein
MAAERPEDVDEEFNRIVAGMGPGWPAGLPAWPDPPAGSDPATVAQTADTAPGPTPAGNADEAPIIRSADQHEHFKPAPPPPLPRPDPVTALCWLLVLGAPVVLTLLTLAGWYVPRWTLAMVGLGFVGGVVTLVLRLEDRPRDSDDGAVV